MKITKYLILSIFSFVFANTSLAQVDNYIGAKAGYVFSALNVDIVQDTMVINQGKTFGLTFKSFSSKNTAIQIEIIYTDKGGNSLYDTSLITDTLPFVNPVYPFVLKTKYIEMPVIMHLNFGKDKNKFVLNVGPNISYAFASEFDYFYDNAETLRLESKIHNSFEFGLNFGAGYERKFKNSLIDFEIRYSHGLTSIFKSKTLNYSLLSQNQVISFALLYYLKLK